jgi:hypothetical protein
MNNKEVIRHLRELASETGEYLIDSLRRHRIFSEKIGEGAVMFEAKYKCVSYIGGLYFGYNIIQSYWKEEIDLDSLAQVKLVTRLVEVYEEVE